jgi:hypothetical protein
VAGLLKWLKANGEKVALGSVALVALIVSLFTHVTEWLGISGSFHERIPEAILFLLAAFVLVFLFGYQRDVEKMSSTVEDCRNLVEQSRAGIAESVQRWEGMGITTIYLSRADRGQKDAYVNILQGFEKDLFVVGVTLKDLTHDERPQLLTKCAVGGSIRFLMLTPERWQNRQPVLDPIEPGNLKEHFTQAVRNIRALAKGIAERNKAANRGSRRGRGSPCFEVRFYDQSPSVSLAIADSQLRSGRMRVEFTPHNDVNLGSYFRPMMDIVPTDDKGLFRQFCKHYEGLWENSKPYVRVVGAQISRNKDLDFRVAAEKLGLEADWVPPDLAGEDLP